MAHFTIRLTTIAHELDGRTTLMNYEEVGKKFIAFVQIIKQLRTPETGCPWDLKQDHESLRPYLIEEAHEVLYAIDNKNDISLADELGDVLLQVVLHAQVAEDRGAFEITQVLDGVAAKMVRRHPHVFSSVKVKDADEVVKNWEQIKLDEAKQNDSQLKPSAHPISDKLRGIPPSLPALIRAQRLGEKASKVKFDWSCIDGVLDKVKEEFDELQAEMAKLGEESSSCCKPIIPVSLKASLEHELGDLLFSLCQLARWLDLNAEDALRICSERFLARFERMEQSAAGPSLSELKDDELDLLWREAKKFPPAPSST